MITDGNSDKGRMEQQMKRLSKMVRWMVASAPLFLVASSAMAEGTAAVATGGDKFGGGALAAALAIGLAAFGGALGQGKAASAALDGIARNPGAQPKIMVPMIIALALIESLVIYGLLIAMKLSGIF
jgi:F-type H+-transporting ATPase subunit c